MLPFYLSDGSNPRRSDTRWFRLTKILSASNDICGSLPQDHSSLHDTQAVLEDKIYCTAAGVPYAGFGRRPMEPKRARLVDILNAYIATCGAAPANSPRKTDTWRILEQKILATVSGQTYNG